MEFRAGQPVFIDFRNSLLDRFRDRIEVPGPDQIGDAFPFKIARFGNIIKPVKQLPVLFSQKVQDFFL